MRENAKYFHSLGLNVYAAGSIINEYNFDEANMMKSPFHRHVDLYSKRQTLQELNEIEWEDVTGIGCVLGFNFLCAIDIDGAVQSGVVREICAALNLPENYPWIVKSGSQCGFHILIKCKTPFQETSIELTKGQKVTLQSKPLEFGAVDTNAYYPHKQKYGTINSFYKIEFKWKGHLILPPSSHKTGKKYSFVNGTPNTEPVLVDFEKLLNIQYDFCSTQANSSTHVSRDWATENYSSTTVTSYKVPYPDSALYNHEFRPYCKNIVFNICQYQIYNFSNPNLFVTQIAWFVNDASNNVLKRRIFNYYDTEAKAAFNFGNLDIKTSKRIVDNKRFVFHELLFDMLHAREVVCFDKEQLDLLKSEIENSGLYLDSLLTNFEVKDSMIV